MLSNEKGLKRYYHFIANNPHLSLRDICQIITYRENINYCLSFEEWNAVNRRIALGSKGIPYYDINGNKRFVFDVNDTYGKEKFQLPTLPIKQLLHTLYSFNHHQFNEDEESSSDFEKIYQEVEQYLPNEDKNHLEGIAYYLLCKTGLSKNNDVSIQGLPFSLKENALVVKDVCEKGDSIIRDVEKFIFEEKQQTVNEEKEAKQSKKEKNKTFIRNRKRKEKTLLDLLDLDKGEDEMFIESQLLKGSGFENGKKRIYEKYVTNPTIKEFADFLKDEYGIGGHHSSKEDFSSNSKGIQMINYLDENHHEIYLNWKEVAIRIADLIDENKYVIEKDKAEISVESIVDLLIEQGIENSSEGSWIVYFDEFEENESFVLEHLSEIEESLKQREEIAEVVLNKDSFDMIFWDDYLNNYQREELEEETHSTNLNELDIHIEEFGGLKERFKQNVRAIELANQLTSANQVPNQNQLQILAKYVGWGGLSQAFDEQDKNWRKEYQHLKELLSTEDYEAAKASVLNAHYTSKEIIEGIYQALHQFGVRGNNRILEPAMGIGNFFGYMPQEIKDKSKLYGVEVDKITGKIAKLLYPDVRVHVQGFEETNFPNNFFDVVITNVPFGAYSVYDPEYNQHHFYIHDYFIAKSLDKVRCGGIVAVVTSKGTMDKANPSVRKYIADRAKLLGAIRLPNNAFEQSAKTKVTTDILFFQKRNEKIESNIENTDWLELKETKEGFKINNYFIKNPQMLLGTLVEERGLYGAIDITLKPDERDLSEAISDAITYLPQNIYEYNVEKKEVEERKEIVEVDYSTKPFCYKVIDEKLYMRIGDEMVEQTIPKKPQDALKRIALMIDLREELHHILEIQSNHCSDEQLLEAQNSLNEKYDYFVKNYGFLNNQTNFKLFKDDGDSALLFSCENLSEDKKTAIKSDVFSKRTIRPYLAIVKTSDCLEALQFCKNEKGKVDIAFIEEITNKSYNTIISELGNAIFRNPSITDLNDDYSGFETAENYLSGNVVQKLQLAKTFSQKFPQYHFERNVKALEEVQPAPLKASDISVRLGVSWLDDSYYQQFICEILNMSSWLKEGLHITYNAYENAYRVEAENYVKWGVPKTYNTARANVFRLYEDCLNLKSTTIYDTEEDSDGKIKRIFNKEETIAAREKQNRLKEEFKNWIFKDVERREELEQTYNSIFNQIRLPHYDGSYLKFPKMNPAIELRTHQKDAVHRILTSGNTLLHHVVGAGKTYTMCATIMKLREYGLAKKPMVVVPNHLVVQWGNEFRTLYPDAKLLITTKEDLEKHNRQRFVSKVALGDWDAIIIAQSSFAKIPISLERQVNKIKEEIKKVELTILNQDKKSRGSIKNLERIKKNKETKLKQLLDKGDKDNVLIFEKLGVDYLFVDEADCYKNLFLFTKMNNVSGISNAASQRASDLQLKCEYINEIHQKDIGVVFATGTPISNSMTEMYTMQTYLMKRKLEELGIPFFDNWAADFGETLTSLELAPSGQGYKAKTRFAKFTNLPELLTMYRSFADVQTSEMVKLKVPKVDRKTITLQPTDTILNLTDQLAKRAEAISNKEVDPHVDNMLKITSDGKKIALDPRYYDPILEDEENNKINVCVKNVFEIWKNSENVKGTQLIFCDLSTPKKSFSDYVQGKDFDVYNELKVKLVQLGIPQDEIAFIHEANSDIQKQTLFQKINEGKIRVLIGSTEKCGAGTNIQRHLLALHHLDTPYRPRDLQQREGRIVRQGNLNEEVTIYTYVTERTFDSYSYQILENKQRFISQIDKGDLTIREADDIDETTLTYAEIKAITAANPKIKRKMEVDTEISRLRILEGQFKRNLYELQDKVRHELPNQIERQNQYISYLKKDIQYLKETYDNDKFVINVQGIDYSDKKEGAIALMNAINIGQTDTIIAEYSGFKISLNPIVFTQLERTITLSHEQNYMMYIGQSGLGNITRLDNFIEEFPQREKRANQKLEQLLIEFEEAKKEVARPFEYQSKLEELIEEQIKINTELDLNKKEEVIINNEEEISMNNKKIINEEENRIENTNFLLPDSQITINQMNEYGYQFDGMYPLSYETAKKLFDKGCTIFLLYENNTESIVEQKEDIDKHYGIYGIEIPEWNTFLEQEETKNYYYARYVLCASANKVVNKEMDYMDERFNFSFNERNFEELHRLSRYFQDKPIPNAKQLKPYLSELLDEFTDRLSGPHLMHYGWDKSDVTYSLSQKIENEEIRNLTSQLLIEKNVLDHNLLIFYNHKLQEINGTSFDLDFQQIQKILPIMEEELKGSIWDSSEQGNYHQWFIHFAKKTFPYYLNIKEEDREKVMEYLSEKELSIKEIVLKNVQEEFREYQEKELLKSKEEIFNDSYQIHFYIEINDFLNNTVYEMDEVEYKGLIEDKQNVLGYLYNYYIKDEYTSINNYEEITDLIHNYNIRYHSEILNQKEEINMNNEMSSKKEYIRITLPYEALIEKYANHSFFKMPQTSEYKGYTYNIPNQLVKDSRRIEDLKSDSWELCLAIQIDKNSIVRLNQKDKESVELSAMEFAKIVNESKKSDYIIQKKRNWINVTMPSHIVIAKYDESTLLQCPKGEYQNYAYFMPNQFINENKEENTLQIFIPKNFNITLRNYQKNEMIELETEKFAEIFQNTTPADYDVEIKKPSEYNRFQAREEQLNQSIPQEMKNRPNWCVLRTRMNHEKGRLDKFIIDCHTGKFAKSDDPTTWTDFTTACEYARKNKAVSLVYALDGKDEIACIDLDHCIDENKEFSPLAKEVIAASNGTYCEESISGTGLHLFGKTKGMDLRSFSKDGDLEFYQKVHFIAMTGKVLQENKLESFDNDEMKNLLERKCDKRTTATGIGKGIEGLSSMSDIEVVEKASHAKNGNIFKALYEGQNLQNNHSNSDMSLMNHLAFWCNGDKEQMLRIFATSGLYRESKSPEYYEYTATKAIQDTLNRFDRSNDSKKGGQFAKPKSQPYFEKA